MNPLQQFFHGTDMDELDALVLGRHEDPHHALGAHPVEKGVVLRVWRPEAQRVSVEVEDGGAHVLMTRIHPAGVWAAWLPTATLPYHPWIESRYADGATSLARDPYSFLPTWGELDLHLFGEGRIARVDKHLGAHPRTVDGVSGVAFAVWAPNARQVRVVGDWNQWNGRLHPMRRIGASGVWELFVPGALPGALYQFEVAGRDGRTVRKVDPCARRAELRPGQAGIVDDPTPYAWRDAQWIAQRAETKPRPLSVYEMHPGSWRRVPEEGDRWLTWRELAPGLIAHVRALGFTHVELMAVAEHPFDGSWGYQVTGYFAPTARFGSPEDFRWFVDELHAHDIGVIVDWVPAHFPKDEFALARFDGTGLYEHADPRQGEHPDWHTLVFNYARFEVRNFLLSNARMWIEDFHVDGLRVDAVASMLYLDYSRPAGEWIPNQHGGRENLAAIAFLRELNGALRKEFPGVMVLAEESTSWPGVTHAVSAGGLGFTHKWNMGWMHDTLAYFARDPVHRRYHHNELTFGILYAWSERFVLALSHDEVVHLKKSLLGKMPGDRWQQFANLRCLYAWMWCHPGKKLLFMGGEFAQVGEWSHQRSLDWHLVRDRMHHGVMDLVGDLNMLLRREPALYEADDVTEGFQWVDTHDAEQSVLSFLRFDASRSRFVLCVLHATPEVRGDYRVGVPSPGRYAEVINTDAGRYGGSNVGNLGGVTADEVPRHGFPYSLSLTLPPLSVLVFTAP